MKSKHRKFVHACAVAAGVPGRRTARVKKTPHPPAGYGRNNNELVRIYDKFYKNQISSLYSAVFNAN